MNRSTRGLVVVIPAFNEARTIRDIVRRALPHADEVVVVDDGSTDGTAGRLTGLPVSVIRSSRNRGKAAALREGIRWAMSRGSAIVTLDADGQHRPEDIPLLEAIHTCEPTAIVIGARILEVASIPRLRRIAHGAARFWISLASGCRIRDSQSGFRLYPARALKSLESRCDWTCGFALESELLIEAGKAGIPIREVPIAALYGDRLRRSHFRHIRDTWAIIRMVARKILTGPRGSGPRSGAASPQSEDAAPLSSRRSSGNRPRVLFVAEAVTLAHVGRVSALANMLDVRRFEVHLACDPRYASFVRNVQASFHPLDSITPATFAERLRRGDPLYSADELRAYVREDLRLLSSLAPSAVIGDMRVSLSVAARVAGIPYLTITNAHWSPFARSRYLVPELAITHRLGPRVGQLVFDAIRPFVLAQQVAPLNRVRKDYGLPPIGPTLAHMFTDADRVLYADVPALVPTFSRPAHHSYLGPMLWSPVESSCLPDDLPRGRPLVYVSLGSSGPERMLPVVLQALERSGCAGIVSTAGKPASSTVPLSVRTREFLPGCEAAGMSDLVVCNGGSATVYQAMAAGVPVLGIPTNLDQYVMMSHVERAGAGAWMRAGTASTDAMTRHITRLLHEPGYRQSARRMQAAIRSGEGLSRLDQILDGLPRARSFPGEGNTEEWDRSRSGDEWGGSPHPARARPTGPVRLMTLTVPKQTLS